MKNSLLIMLFVLMVLLASSSMALDLPVEKEKILMDKTSFTFGLGWAGNEFLGGVVRNGLGYPKAAFGLNNWLGFSYTWIYGAPSNQEIMNAIDAVASENGGAETLRDYDLKMLTKQKLNIGSYNYFRLGTAYLLFPVVVQYGWMWPVGDVGRFQLGFGLPLLLNLGINFDF